jgi:hypothetical protein
VKIQSSRRGAEGPLVISAFFCRKGKSVDKFGSLFAKLLSPILEMQQHPYLAGDDAELVDRYYAGPDRFREWRRVRVSRVAPTWGAADLRRFLVSCLEPRHPAAVVVRVDAQNNYPNCYFAEFATRALARAVISGLQGVKPSPAASGLFLELSRAAKGNPPRERDVEEDADRQGIDRTDLQFEAVRPARRAPQRAWASVEAPAYATMNTKDIVLNTLNRLRESARAKEEEEELLRAWLPEAQQYIDSLRRKHKVQQPPAPLPAAPASAPAPARANAPARASAPAPARASAPAHASASAPKRLLSPAVPSPSATVIVSLSHRSSQASPSQVRDAKALQAEMEIERRKILRDIVAEQGAKRARFS